MLYARAAVLASQRCSASQGKRSLYKRSRTSKTAAAAVAVSPPSGKVGEKRRKGGEKRRFSDEEGEERLGGPESTRELLEGDPTEGDPTATIDDVVDPTDGDAERDFVDDVGLEGGEGYSELWTAADDKLLRELWSERLKKEAVSKLKPQKMEFRLGGELTVESLTQKYRQLAESCREERLFRTRYELAQEVFKAYESESHEKAELRRDKYVNWKKARLTQMEEFSRFVREEWKARAKRGLKTEDPAAAWAEILRKYRAKVKPLRLLIQEFEAKKRTAGGVRGGEVARIANTKATKG
eukprot:Hpha_TRINITY_DN3404_c0_g1::TRINITY_DN3404_c0_g1_i1::g.32525::m.32525